MSRFAVIILLALFTQAPGNQVATKSNAQDTMDQLADKLVDKFIHRALSLRAVRHADMDTTTLGKLGSKSQPKREAPEIPLEIPLDLEHFPGALPGPVVHWGIVKILQEYGFTPENTILGTSLCPDEINTLKGALPDVMKDYWGENFILGGIGGAPYVGKTGFGAFSHHVPDNGNVLVLFGPHVGITINGDVGQCLRDGQASPSAACGACIAAYKQTLSGEMPADMDLDMQQSWLRAQIVPHVERIKASKNPMAEVAKTFYNSVLKKMTGIANTKFGPGYLALVGGIQINMPKGYPDYFLPLHFTIQRKDNKPKDMLESFKVSMHSNLNHELNSQFPGALSGPVLHERLVKILRGYGFTPENTILGTSLCSDEINTVRGTLPDIMKEFWGETFPLGGIGGAPYVGKTGFLAFSHHVPDNGNVLVLFGPHVGITLNGDIGQCLRDGQKDASTACGACIAAYKQSLAGGIAADFDLDMQQSWLRAQIEPHCDRIAQSTNPMGELAKVSYEAVLKKMTAIANTDFGPGYLALVGGIQINMPKAPDYFMPLYFTLQKKDFLRPEGVDLLDSLRR